MNSSTHLLLKKKITKSTTPSCSRPLPTHKIKRHLIPGSFILLPLIYVSLKNVMSMYLNSRPCIICKLAISNNCKYFQNGIPKECWHYIIHVHCPNVHSSQISTNFLSLWIKNAGLSTTQLCLTYNYIHIQPCGIHPLIYLIRYLYLTV